MALSCCCRLKRCGLVASLGALVSLPQPPFWLLLLVVGTRTGGESVPVALSAVVIILIVTKTVLILGGTKNPPIFSRICKLKFLMFQKINLKISHIFNSPLRSDDRVLIASIAGRRHRQYRRHNNWRGSFGANILPSSYYCTAGPRPL